MSLPWLLALALLATAAGTASPSAAPSAAPVRPAVSLPWVEVARVPHDTQAFTEGLAIDAQGRMFESTGLRGHSSVREVDRADGGVLRSRALPDTWFGEGLALVGDSLVQLTWKDGEALRWDSESFELQALQAFEGEGWGLCFDGERLVMSDGSSRLTFRDATTFEVSGSVEVTFDGRPLEEINELECVGDVVWANVWHEDRVVRIDPADGQVTGWLDLRGLIEPHPADSDPEAVLNGIAWDGASGTMWVTGKRWPQMIELRLLEGADQAS